MQELLRVIGSAAGQPFSDFNVAGDRDNVLALYYDQGFPAARFTSSVEELPAADSQGPRVQLTYHVDEGAQLRVARVLVDGYDHTRLGVISREIQIKAGKPLSEGDVVETQRRLYNLEIFNRVSIAPQNPDGTDPDKTVDVLVEEARRYTIAYGPGLEVQRLGSPSAGPTAEPLRFSPRGTFEFTKLNLTGRADSLSFKVRASTLQGRALLTYSYPNFLGQPKLTVALTGLYDKTRDVLTFTSTRGEGSAQLTDHATPSTSFLFRYVYRHVLASNLEVEPEEIPLFSQPTEVSFFSATWVRDRRDNAADPGRGSFNTVDVDFASKYYRLELQFRPRHGAEFDLYAHRIAAGFCAFDAVRHSGTGRANHRSGHSPAGTVLRRRRNDAARLWLESSRPARSADRFSHRRPGDADFQSTVAVSHAAAA